MADYVGDVPLCMRTCLSYIPGTSLEEQVLAPSSLKDDDCILIIAEQVEKLVCKLGSPQLEGHSGIESIEVTNGRVVPEYTGRECSMLHSARCEGSTPRHAGVNVRLDWVPAILNNDKGAIHGGEETSQTRLHPF